MISRCFLQYYGITIAGSIAKKNKKINNFLLKCDDYLPIIIKDRVFRQAVFVGFKDNFIV